MHLRKPHYYLFLSLILLLSVLFFFINSENSANFSYLFQLEAKTVAYLDTLQKKAAASFLVARGLNATLSVIQSLTLSPFIGDIQIGQILDPVNDMIERFSWVMLLVSVIIGIEKLLLTWSNQIALLWLLALLLIWGGLHYYRAYCPKIFISLLKRLLLLSLLLRFALPLMLLSAEKTNQQLLAEKQQIAQQNLFESKQQLAKIDAVDSLTSPKQTLIKMEKQAEIIITETIQLMTLFLFEVLVYPLLCLWLLLWLVRMKIE